MRGLGDERLGGEIERVEHRPTAAEEEGIGPPQAQRAAERGLEAHALRGDPRQHLLRLADHEAGEILVGVATGHAQQVVPKLLLGVGPRERLRGAVMGTAHVAGVAGGSPPHTKRAPPPPPPQHPPPPPPPTSPPPPP